MKSRFKLCISMIIFCTLILLLSSCGSNEQNIGEEFTLHVGETADIRGESLQIRFIEISEDSRCPRDVTCVWEGRAIVNIEVVKGTISQKVDLVEQGLSDGSAKEQFGQYEFQFKILPYPEKAEVKIESGEYRLMLTVNKN